MILVKVVAVRLVEVEVESLVAQLLVKVEIVVVVVERLLVVVSGLRGRCSCYNVVVLVVVVGSVRSLSFHW